MKKRPRFIIFAGVMEISFEPAIKDAAPLLTVMCVEADIDNGPTSDTLWSEICGCAAGIRVQRLFAVVR